MTPRQDLPLHIWRRFCQRFGVLDASVPLFSASAEGVVTCQVIGRGETARRVLMRSTQMEALMLRVCAKLVEDWQAGRHRYDGLIYCMGFREPETFVPIYIGKAETLGKGSGNLSANLRNLETDRSKFARWGNNYAYHIGDLSACVLPGHRREKQTAKYEAWARQLFAEFPSSTPKLQRPVSFWAMAWDPSVPGIWEELGPTSLAFLEYLMIGVAGLVSPALLNREGIGRGAAARSARGQALIPP